MSGEQKIVRCVERANQRVRRYLAAHLDELGITEIEAHLLARLSAKGPISVGELQRAFGLRPSTLTNALDRLERRGLIERAVDPTDRRTYTVRLTRAGARAARAVIALVDSLEARIADEVSEKQLAAFLAVTAALERAVG
jgi:DNA-binding MarR family transcriptional regulator